MDSENDLLKACRVLFGPDIELSSGFLDYLQEEGIAGAFRKRAMEIHPDKVTFTGISPQEANLQFLYLQNACKMLRRYIARRHHPTKSLCSGNLKNNISASVLPVLPGKRLLFGRFLYHAGIIDFKTVLQAVSWQKSGRPRLGEMGLRLGYLDRRAISAILKNIKADKTFGLTAWEMGLLTKEEVRELLRRQMRQQKRIGQFFVEKGILSNSELAVLLVQFRKHNSNIKSIS